MLTALLIALFVASSAFGARQATKTDPVGDTLGTTDLISAQVGYSVESGTASAVLDFASPVEDTTNLVATIQFGTYTGGLGGECGSGQTSGSLGVPAGGSSQVTLAVNEFTSFNGGREWDPARTRMTVSGSDRRVLERKIDLECVTDILIYDWSITTLVDQISSFDLPIYTPPKPKPKPCSYICKYKKQVSACKKKYKKKRGLSRSAARKRAASLKRCVALAVYKKDVAGCKKKFAKKTGDSNATKRKKAAGLKKCTSSAKKKYKKKLKKLKKR